MGLHLSRPISSNDGQMLLSAIGHGQVSEVKEILEHNPKLSGYAKPLQGTSPLHLAAAAGRADIVEALLSGLDASLQFKSVARRSKRKLRVVNQRNLHGQTALMLACKAGSAACVRLLLGAGADPTLFDNLSHCTCLHYSARYGYAQVIDVLLGDDSWVVAPALEGESRRQLLREAVLVDSQGAHKFVNGRAALGLAPLHLAAAQRHLAAAQALIEWGASISARCNLFLEEGQGNWVPFSTPLHLAAAKGDVVMARTLLAAWAQQAQRSGRRTLGPDPRTLRDFWDRRPMDVALAAGHGNILSLLSPMTSLSQVMPLPESPMPRLASIAAATLRRQLSTQLEQIAVQRAQQAALSHREAALPSTQPCHAGHCCPICLEEEEGGLGNMNSPLARSSPAAAAPAAAAGVAGSPRGRALLSQGQPAQRPLLCLVQAKGCGHALCVPCARELCRTAPVSGRGGGAAPVTCPLCRAVVGGWVLAAATV